jgi:hypothetical protein
MLAAREPPHIERAIIGAKTVQSRKTRTRIGGSRRRSSFPAVRVKRSARSSLTQHRGLA